MTQQINSFLIVFLSYLLALAIFADAHHYKTSEYKISPCCKASGSPGWTNEMHHATAEDAFPELDVTTAQHCCQKCVENLDCIQWVFGPGGCRTFFERIPFPLVSICSSSLGQPLIPDGDSGVIRCEDDGCYKSCETHEPHE
ncbi:hypothetical protein F8M41_022415 [Gigaspora margarita]|uniref:Apple domain-containing protein n=1 Tax=Gigaspora margarita TaxID=4874 RepID=A0A8H4AF33_GIGMA|nr:hypothetical protein F8M41_022415 [Gigaspora margarita]